MKAVARSASSLPHAETAKENADHGSSEARKQRKKNQNRLNQRAHRRRVREREALKGKAHRRPYRVDSWRIEGCNVSLPENSGMNSNSTNKSDNSSPSRRRYTSPAQPLHGFELDRSGSHEVEIPLPFDHLLHLIHHNVLRALMSNKDTIRISTTPVSLHCHVPKPHLNRSLCNSYTAIRPLDRNIPDSLVPTRLQMSRPHSPWIDMLPFPQIRDNLIKWEAYFDHVEFCKDLFGEIINDNIPSTQDGSNTPPTGVPMAFEGEDNDAITTGRKGLIVWGEPYVKESWEATPGFLRKWMWVWKGCEELIDISNRWRAIRGEPPIRLSTRFIH